MAVIDFVKFKIFKKYLTKIFRILNYMAAAYLTWGLAHMCHWEGPFVQIKWQKAKIRHSQNLSTYKKPTIRYVYCILNNAPCWIMQHINILSAWPVGAILWTTTTLETYSPTLTFLQAQTYLTYICVVLHGTMVEQTRNGIPQLHMYHMVTKAIPRIFSSLVA